MNKIDSKNNNITVPHEPVNLSHQAHIKGLADKICDSTIAKINTLNIIRMPTKQPAFDELIVLKDLISLLNEDQLVELFKGAHVCIDDEGVFYDKWSRLSTAHSRISSHPHIVGSKQYGIQGPWTHEILFGICDSNQGRVETWLQLENTPLYAYDQNWVKKIIIFTKHTVDFFSYRLKGKNIGPYGESIHTDRNPLRLSIKN